ncbi:MerR family transcriptional regulator [Streptomyces sp. 6N223]|uniref:MerR family transcriptional regulator n=1 Tax=Streptomyces sp. 6N223 TaxID=3457412 RepID=UPI003FD28B00
MLIGELSRHTGVSARLLRYYEEQRLLEARRGPNGYRDYDEDAVVTVRQIRALLNAGLTTDVIREVLPCARGERPEIDMCVDLRAILGHELAAIDEQIGSLQRRRSTLADYLGGPCPAT